MADCFFKQEISLAILLLLVLIRCKLIPRGELINNEQKKQVSNRTILDFLQECSVQDNAGNVGRLEDVKCYGVVDNHCHELKNVD